MSLTSRAAATGTFTGLMLGLGAVALLVGGIGLYPAVRASRVPPTVALTTT